MQFDLRADLAALKASAKVQIDVAAEVSRLKYITPGAGQAMVYQAKLEEAQRYLATTSPSSSATDWPMLSAELGISGAALVDVANTIVAIAGQWIGLAQQIEKLRLGGKQAVDAATNGSQIAAATVIAWP